MLWDVMCGVARRSWARNENSITTAIEFNKNYDGLGHITIPYLTSQELIDEVVDKAYK
jgi:urocanate hydratase